MFIPQNVDETESNVGESKPAQVEGRGVFDASSPLPRLDVALSAERIQLDDFPLADWSPFEARDPPAGPLTAETIRKSVAAGARQVHAIFSKELLGRSEGEFDLAVKRVLAGTDELGRGRIHARVENGRATIGPIEVEAHDGGSARGSLIYEPRDRDVVVAARARIDRFDYGRLARRVRPGSAVDGTVSMDFRLDATAPRLSAAIEYGTGRYDFAIWPRRVNANVFDFWTVNLVFRLLPIIDVSASPMNCLVGHFDLERGKLRSVRLVIDTVNTRTEGGGRADFATDEIYLRFVPRPKVPQFFSLATPVEVRGTLDDYGIRLRPADVLGTAVQWVTSLVTVPFQRAFGTRIPEDGHDVCENPGR